MPIKEVSDSGATASVIILPGGESDSALVDLVEQWTKCWLLKPAFWVSVNDFNKIANQTAKVMATIVGRNGRKEIDFLQYLSRNEINCINLIAIRLIEENTNYNGQQDDLVDLVNEKRTELIEKLADVDDEIAELFINETEPTAEQLKKAIRTQTISRKFEKK